MNVSDQLDGATVQIDRRGRWEPTRDEWLLSDRMRSRGASWAGVARALGRPEPDVRRRLDSQFCAPTVEVSYDPPKWTFKIGRTPTTNSIGYRVMAHLAKSGVQTVEQIVEPLGLNRDGFHKECGKLRQAGFTVSPQRGSHEITNAGRAAMREIESAHRARRGGKA